MNDELRVKNNELGGKMKYRYRTDEEMKDSGVEWIGEIPKEWSITKLKYISCCEDGKRVPLSSDERGKMQGDIPYWGANSIIDYVNDYLIDYEVVLLGEDGAPFFDKTKPVAFYSNGKIWPNNHIHILKSQKDMDSRFLVNSLNIVDYKNYIKGSTRDKLTQADMKEIIIQIPKLKKEQIKISKFLDEKTAQFDSIISKKEALIEKLEEAKKSLISEVVTGKVKVVKTDDGYELVERKKEEMKDSGVEWLGLVPTEWKIYRSKYLWKKEKREVKEEYGVVTAFRDGEVTLRENRRTEGFTFAIKEIGYQGVLKGDLVISAMDAFAGAMGISDSEGKCSPVYSVCSPVKELEPQYYNYLLKEMSQKGYILSLAKGIRERSTDFRYSEFANTFLLYPNIEEQKIIANYLFEKVIFINNFIITINNQIEKLKEAKQSLISEAVTGKIEILD